ncbi:2795_t:CDS:2 [Diversispora eburnea]|uniref:2795_t:CDS:1 n=1 Tax=Diversispora eburnea TaxID=1213867 RepID=A0A9N9B354_9GLOM|nr:2795_t:CDS:2 [Diversispora eburnea]
MKKTSFKIKTLIGNKNEDEFQDQSFDGFNAERNDEDRNIINEKNTTYDLGETRVIMTLGINRDEYWNTNKLIK